MLLLVLILVLVAFGLLVLSLLAGSVMWAWVSVAVSVAAAAVLLVDWLQWRSAGKAGAAAIEEPAVAEADVPRAAVPRSPVPAHVDLDPATEVLPIVPRSMPAGGPAAGPDPVADAQQTIVMPVVQPSGSAERPSGATPSITSSGALSSPSVTVEGVDRPAPTPPSGDDGGTGSSAAEEPTVLGTAPAAGGPAEAPADSATAAADSADSATADFAGVDSAGDDRSAAGTAAGESGGTATPAPDSAGTAAPADDPTAVVPRGEVSSSGVEDTVAVDLRSGAVGSPASGSDLFTPPDRAGVPAVEEAAPAADVPTAVAPSDDSAPEVPAPDATVSEPTTTVAAPQGVAAASEAATDQAGGGPDGTAAADAAPEIPAQSYDGAPPEEPRDLAAAALVAGLPDEVVVVDEQPRYHVPECRSLFGKPLIPLPVREAVELGFTPCGWCSPDRTLVGRHPATAR